MALDKLNDEITAVCIITSPAHLVKLRTHLAIFCKFDQKCNAADQIRTHLAKRCAFGQMLHISSIGQMRCALAQMHRLVKCTLHQHQSGV